MPTASALRSSMRVRATLALAFAAGCPAVRHAELASAPLAGPCMSARTELRTELHTLLPSADLAKRQSYATVASRMLLLCDHDVRSMTAQFVDDWRIRSYVVERDLQSLVVIGDSGFAALLPGHRRRVERLLALYAGMFGNPPAPGDTR